MAIANTDKNKDLPTCRKDALRLKSKRYYRGIECVNGHDSAQVTKSGACVACIREARYKTHNQYAEQRNSINRKKIEAIKDEYVFKEVWED